MTAVKLRKIGNSLGLVIPMDVLAQMRVGEGDVLHLTKASGGIKLSPYDPVFERQMEVARKVMRDNRNALRELAK